MARLPVVSTNASATRYKGRKITVASLVFPLRQLGYLSPKGPWLCVSASRRVCLFQGGPDHRIIRSNMQAEICANHRYWEGDRAMSRILRVWGLSYLSRARPSFAQ